MTKASAPEEQLGELFGSYRAEWLSERIYELFTEPAYFPELLAPTACVLEGGRGTGKTTVLRGLSYEGQFALRKRQPERMKELNFIGCYMRIDTNVVTAFQGPELQESSWIKSFAHYVNLLVCEQIVAYWVWYLDNVDGKASGCSARLAKVAAALHLPTTEDCREVRDSIQNSIIAFEAYINNVADDRMLRPPLSLQGAPIRLMTDALLGQPDFAGKRVFVLVDEYENLLDYQQRVFNTLLKHGAERLTYKIAIRELGWKCRTTLNPDEQLRTPADYNRISIAEKLQGRVFRDFALKVCNDRVRRLDVPGIGPKTSIEDLLPALSEDDEATLLLGTGPLQLLRDEYASHALPEHRRAVFGLSSTDILLIQYFSGAENAASVQELIAQAVNGSASWRNRRTNYGHAVLFTVRRGKRGVRKYYSGWDTFIQLSNGNIRLLLALVDQCLHAKLREGRALDTPISPDVQTRAAQLVGKGNLADLEGLSVYGARLTKLLLALGRIFGVLAAQPEGHAPEQTQFELATASPPEAAEDVDELLKAAVMHLALIRPEGTKPTDVGDTKDYDYMIHPIFAPFFVTSYRRNGMCQSV